jgi:glutamate/tyrosine decarboxylase-like PLP-dependent enzyme
LQFITFLVASGCFEPGKQEHHFYTMSPNLPGMEDIIPRYKDALAKALEEALQFFKSLEHLPVGAPAGYDELKALWPQDLPENGLPAQEVVRQLSQSATPGLNLNQSGRFFAWVIGGSHPAALAADWLTSVWDQNAGMFKVAPSAAIAEEISGAWLKSLLHLPAHASFAFVTGCQMANFTCLAAARNQLFHQAGWDIESNGFFDAPKVRIITGDYRHNTIDKSLRMLGFGTSGVVRMPSDAHGRIDVDRVKQAFERDPSIPTMLILQAGEIHTGAFDDFKTLIPLAHQHKAWVHIDGAFGLWAAASNKYRHLTEGVALADSWATDGHKWLNVPYDSGYAFVAQPEAHYRSQASTASYLSQSDTARDQSSWNPELSRRARGFATYAVIRELGASGIEALVDRCCHHAESLVNGMAKLKTVEVLAYPIINQGVIRFKDPTSSDEHAHDLFTDRVVEAINATGVALFQPSTFKGKRCMRISVSGWRTSEEDVQRTLHAIKGVLENM